MKKSLFICLISIIIGCSPENDQKEECDVIIIGGGASGTMAGIQASRLGSTVLIVEETPWLGGMLTSAGVSAIDGNYRLYSGLWQEFRERIYRHYGGEDSVKTGWVSNVLFEPIVGADIFRNMTNNEDKLKVWFHSSVNFLEYKNGYWEIKVTNDHQEKSVKGKIVIDGTELGDISKMVGIPYDIGMDSRMETYEEIAPVESNDIIQDLTYVVILKDYGDNAHLIERPENYDPSPFQCTCAGKCNQDTISRKLWDCDQMMNYGKLPNGKYMINWPIYGNDFYVNAIELSKEERKIAFDQAKWFTKCYVYYLQHELGFAHFGIADDVFQTKDGFPFFPYHRESRRIKGVVRFDINDLARPFEQEDALYRTGIAVGDYPVDHHHAAYPDHEDLPDLHFYPVPSYSLPLGTLIPKNVNHFIVAEKSISVTNLVNGTTRLQPVCLLIGQAAGVLAHLAAESGSTPGEMPVRKVQDVLLTNGAYIMPYSDITPEDKAFAAVQRIGGTGILKGEGKNIGWENHTLFHPDSVMTYEVLLEGLTDFDAEFNLNRKAGIITVEEAKNLLMDLKSHLSQNNSIDIGVEDNVDLQQIWTDFEFGDLNPDQPITRKQFALLLDKMVDPFHTKQVDHFGNFID